MFILNTIAATATTSIKRKTTKQNIVGVGYELYMCGPQLLLEMVWWRGRFCSMFLMWVLGKMGGL